MSPKLAYIEIPFDSGIVCASSFVYDCIMGSWEILFSEGVCMINHGVHWTFFTDMYSLTGLFVSDVDPGSAERTAQKRKFPSPPHSSNGHSPQDASTSPIKKKKKPGLLNSNNKEQVREVLVLLY